MLLLAGLLPGSGPGQVADALNESSLHRMKLTRSFAKAK
jgi:hypothetical protein